LLRTSKITIAAAAPPIASLSHHPIGNPHCLGAGALFPRVRLTSCCNRARVSGDSSGGAPASSRRFFA
jgi:hypothetical protein